MFAGVRPRILPMLEPEYVAQSMIKSIRRNEVNCTLPDSVRLFLPLKRYDNHISIIPNDVNFNSFSVGYLQKCRGN